MRLSMPTVDALCAQVYALFFKPFLGIEREPCKCVVIKRGPISGIEPIQVNLDAPTAGWFGVNHRINSLSSVKLADCHAKFGDFLGVFCHGLILYGQPSSFNSPFTLVPEVR